MKKTYQNIGATNRISIGAAIICLLTVMLFLTSCGKEETPEETVLYEGWTRYTYGNFEIQFSPNTRFAADKAGVARGFDRFLTELCEMLEMPVPEGTIYLYVYGSPGEAKGITGRETPFSDDSTIHWAGMYSCGYQLTKFLVSKKGMQASRYNVINEGLAHLLDFSGKNYHDRTNRVVNSGQFVGLADLADNSVFDTLPSYAKRSESASLVGYIMFGYGMEGITMLSSSLTDWNESIEALFHMELDVFEKSWLDFAREYSDDPEGTIENDTTNRMRIQVDGQ